MYVVTKTEINSNIFRKSRENSKNTNGQFTETKLDTGEQNNCEQNEDL